jgi:hypothetical protein
MKKLFAFTLLAVVACDIFDRDVPMVCPTCVEVLTKKGDAPLEIWRYRYQGQYVYIVIPDCCDQYISLYDEECQFICAPSGGFTGKGDGRCPGFYEIATEGVLVWKAKRG